jgi:phage shock protein E
MSQQFSAPLFKVTFFATTLFIITLFITSQASTAWATRDEIMIIDVRTLDEWNAGHLATALHMQLERVAESIDAIVPNKDQQVYLYCRSGNRSGQAKIIMNSLGYTNVINAGGLGNASELLAIEIIQ